MIDTRRGAIALAAMLGIAACSGQSLTNPSVPNAPAASSAQHRFAASSMPGVVARCGPALPGRYRCYALERTDVHYDTAPQYQAYSGVAQADLAAMAAKGYYQPLGPDQLQQAYNLPGKTAGKGQTVGIVDAYDDPTAESDLAIYRKSFGLPPCTTANGCFQKLNQQGKASPLPKADPGWSGEISLDLDMVSAICPNCHIVLIEATTNSTADLAASVGAAAAAGAGQISNSYGGPECWIAKTGKVECYSPMGTAKNYDIKGTIITASSADDSWFAGPQTPADFTSVVAVGGTSIYPYNNKRGWFETAWTSAGSSCSVYVHKASWETAKCSGGTRPIADVSAVADPYTGVLVYETYPNTKGGFSVYGGTSVSSPIIASVFALAGNHASLNAASGLYKAPAGSLTDVVIGKNGILGYANDAGQQCTPVSICSAMPGWDGPTGNGTPWGLRAF